MSGGGTTQQSGTSTQVNQIPAWMTNAGQQNYAYSQGVAEQPLQQYQGQMVANTAPQTRQAWNVAANSGNTGADQYNAATGGYLGALGQTPMSVSPTSVTPQTLASTSLKPYEDPYTQQVINATIPIMQQQNALQQNQIQDAAASNNAFGGSRQGIQQGVAQAQGAMNIGQMIAQLQNQNFMQAQAAATGDITRNLGGQEFNAGQNLTAQTTNQAAQQQKVNSDILASQGLTATGDSMNKANASNYNLLTSAGASESMAAQNQINAQMAKFNQAFNYPQQGLGTMLSALGMTPHDTSSSGQTTQQTTTPTDWANLISKGAETGASVMGMFSDKTMKTDITDLGKDPKTGLKMHAFRYKGDPKSYPKVVGPMAQDVQKIAPDAVTPMGKDGKLAIDMRAPIMTGGQHAPTPRSYAAGTSNVQPATDDASKPTWSDTLKKIGGIWGGDDGGDSSAAPASKPSDSGSSGGVNAPSMGYLVSGFAAGTPFVQPSLAAFMPPSSPGVAKGIGAMSAFRPPTRLPRGATMPAMPKRFAGGIAAVPGFGSTDTVPSLLTPGEAVLTPGAAQHVGRRKIAALNAIAPPTGIAGALASLKPRPKIAGGLSGA